MPNISTTSPVRAGNDPRNRGDEVAATPSQPAALSRDDAAASQQTAAPKTEISVAAVHTAIEEPTQQSPESSSIKSTTDEKDAAIEPEASDHADLLTSEDTHKAAANTGQIEGDQAPPAAADAYTARALGLTAGRKLCSCRMMSWR